jgi:SnoaL-like domain
MNETEREAMIAVARAHADAEAEGDIEATMATLVDDPVYELQPRGCILRGHDAARQYYEHFFAECRPRITSYELRSEWTSDEGVLQEYVLNIDNAAGTNRWQHIIGILVFGADRKLAGERLYASDELLEFMFGPVLRQAVTVRD